MIHYKVWFSFSEGADERDGRRRVRVFLGDVKARGVIVRLSLCTAALALLVAGDARAQARAGCDTSHRAAGVAVGRSFPYFEPSLGVSTGSGSVHSRGGLHLAARGELPLRGPWLARFEGGAATWRLEQQIYSADFREVGATETVGHIDVGHIVAAIGRQAGRAPMCGYVLAGGGVYSIDYENVRSWDPGFALVAGIEFPAGPRGAVQVEVQLHFISTSSRYPIGSSTVVDGRLTAGWMFRF